MAETITITIHTEGAAFDEPATEVARILRDLAGTFARHGLPGEKLRDLNGNTCGSVTIRAMSHGED